MSESGSMPYEPVKEKQKHKLPTEWKVKCLMFFSDVFYFFTKIRKVISKKMKL